MSRSARTIALTPDERTEWERRVRVRTSCRQEVLRARISLRTADSARNLDLAAELGIGWHTVQYWRDHCCF